MFDFSFLLLFQMFHVSFSLYCFISGYFCAEISFVMRCAGTAEVAETTPSYFYLAMPLEYANKNRPTVLCHLCTDVHISHAQLGVKQTV